MSKCYRILSVLVDQSVKLTSCLNYVFSPSHVHVLALLGLYFVQSHPHALTRGSVHNMCKKNLSLWYMFMFVCLFVCLFVYSWNIIPRKLCRHNVIQWISVTQPQHANKHRIIWPLQESVPCLLPVRITAMVCASLHDLCIRVPPMACTALA